MSQGLLDKMNKLDMIFYKKQSCFCTVILSRKRTLISIKEKIVACVPNKVVIRVTGDEHDGLDAILG